MEQSGKHYNIWKTKEHHKMNEASITISRRAGGNDKNQRPGEMEMNKVTYPLQYAVRRCIDSFMYN